MNEDLDKSIDKMLGQTGLFGDSENTTNMKDRDNRPTEEDSQFDAPQYDDDHFKNVFDDYYDQVQQRESKSTDTSGEDPHIDSSWLDPIQDEAEKISSNREKEEKLESLRQKEEGLRRNFSNQEEIDTDSDVYKEWEETFNEIQRLEHDDIQEDEPDWLSSQQVNEQERLTERMRTLVDRTNEESSSTSESGDDYEKWKQEKISNSNAHDKAERNRNERLTQVQSILTRIDNGTISDADGTLRSKYEAMSRDLGGKVEDRDSSREENSTASPIAEVSYTTENNPGIDRLMKEIEDTQAEDEFAATTQPHTTIESEEQDLVYEAKSNAQSMIEAALKEPDEDSLGTLLTDFYDRRDRALEDGDEKSAQVYSDYASKLVYLYQLDTNPDESEKIAVDIKEIEERGNASSIDYKTYIGLTYDEDENVQAVATRMANNDERITQEGLTNSQAKEKWDEYVDPFKRERESIQSQSEETQPNRRVEEENQNAAFERRMDRLQSAIDSGFLSQEQAEYLAGRTGELTDNEMEIIKMAGRIHRANRSEWLRIESELAGRADILAFKDNLTEEEERELAFLSSITAGLKDKIDGMPEEAQPQAAPLPFAAQAGPYEVRSHVTQEEKLRAREQAWADYEKFLRIEKNPRVGLIDQISLNQNAGLPAFYTGSPEKGVLGMNTVEQSEHRVRIELSNLVNKKAGAVNFEGLSEIKEYDSFATSEADILEKMPGFVEARSLYMNIAKRNLSVPGSKEWRNLGGAEEELEVFRNYIQEQLRESVTESVNNRYPQLFVNDPEAYNQKIQQYMIGAEQSAFNFLYAVGYFDYQQFGWSSDGEYDVMEWKSQNSSIAVNIPLINDINPINTMVFKALQDEAFDKKSEPFTNHAHVRFGVKAEKMGLTRKEVLADLHHIIVLPTNEKTKDFYKIDRVKVDQTDDDGNVRRVNKYDVYVYTPFAVRVLGYNLMRENRLEETALRGQSIDWTSLDTGMFGKITSEARKANKYVDRLRGGGKNMIKGSAVSGGGIDIIEWWDTTAEIIGKMKQGGDDREFYDQMRDALHACVELNPRKDAPEFSEKIMIAKLNSALINTKRKPRYFANSALNYKWESY